MTDETRELAGRLLGAINSALVDWMTTEDEHERAEHFLRALELGQDAAECGHPVEEIIVSAVAMFSTNVIRDARRVGRDPRDAALSFETRLLHRGGDAAP